MLKKNVSAIVLKLATKVAIALWVAKGITGLMGNNTEGLSSQALQQGGIGLLLTTLIITMPTVAAALWQGSMGTFMAYSAFGTAGASNASSAAPGPQGQPPGSYMPRQISNDNGSNNGQRESITNTHSANRPIVGTSDSLPAPGSRGNAGRTDNFNI
ncbi:hypothetical protein [Xanthomonas axonopodis]|uniref:hypothetical protein n=1 Tax=Xanthomonas axonopodis TaxID=53413 RepID=UPI003556192C